MSTIFVVGNATGDAELGNHNGKDVANVSIAVNSRVKQGEQWVDGPTTFYRVAVWQTGPNDTQPKNVAASIHKGTQVMVKGTLQAREYDNNGQTRTSLDVRAEEIGVGLRFKPAGGGQVAPAGAADPWGGGADSAPF